MDDVAQPAVQADTCRSAGGSRRILITDFDLFRNVGGGQSVYRRFIDQHPEDTFCYFRRREAEDAWRPSNAVAIPFVSIYRSARRRLPRRLAHFFAVYLDCRNMAASVARHSPAAHFDVVDTPDYNQLGLFIRQAMASEGVSVGTVALALHGTLSSAHRGGWPTGADDAPVLAEMHARERLQFRSVDCRYAISKTYAESWERITQLGVNLLDPLSMIAAVQPEVALPSDEPPALAFVGRREKWKGPDLFLDLAWWIDRSRYSRLLLIGPEGPNRLGQTSAAILDGMSRLRGIDPDIVGFWPYEKLQHLFRQRTLLLLPSRHDTFNLLALEALCHGCPALISDQAGMATWLREHIPELDWLIIDLRCARTAAAKASAILHDYDAYRRKLVAAMEHRSFAADQPGLEEIYLPARQTDHDARHMVADLAAQLSLLVTVTERSRLRVLAGTMAESAARWTRAIEPWMPHRLRLRLRSLFGTLTTLWRLQRRRLWHWQARQQLAALIHAWSGFSPRTLVQMRSIRRLSRLQQYMLFGEERQSGELEVKIARLSDQVPRHLPDRVRLFRELARLERRKGNDLVAATYELRVMRWLDRDMNGDLPYVTATLEDAGFAREAEAAQAMFGPPAERFERCLALMQDAYDRNRTLANRPLANLDDRRGPTAPRVAVIVSLYNAADKLPTLLATLDQQTLARRGELEVVLVDSGSPADEHGAFRHFADHHDLPIAYARSARRETIQAAWNRGIRLSRAPYLSFLGVDEGVHPDGLRQLADTLDADPSVDWAMADSLVTSVDRRGVFDADVMPYDRSGYRQDLTYLETCYLSWVGGLYRRSIHDRFGWYDESFRAAGDTEFKNRVLPHIRSVHVPRMLGVFNNYPEERTTQHPRAELEDLRAWYLWRTSAGVHYAFANRPAADAARLLRDALSYRKSYCRHVSTDFDLAAALAEHLASRPDRPAWAAQALHDTREAVELIRSIDFVPRRAPHGVLGAGALAWLLRRLRQARQMAARHQATFGLDARPSYEIFNDNRYEQHWYSWSGR